MTTLLVIYIIGLILHYYGFKYDYSKEHEVILDLPETGEMDSQFTLFSILWPLFWVVFICLFIDHFSNRK